MWPDSANHRTVEFDMESSPMANTSFDFMKTSHAMDEDELKEILQKAIEDPPSPFTLPEESTLDFASLLGEVSNGDGQSSSTKPGADDAVPSVESGDASSNILPNGGTSSPRPFDTVATTIIGEDHTATITSAHNSPVLIGLRNQSSDPLLYSTSFDENIDTSANQKLPLFDDAAMIQALGTYPPDDLALNHNTVLQLPPGHHSRGQIHQHHGEMSSLVPQQYPQERRRSHTAPPEIDSEIMLPRSLVQSPHIGPHNLSYPGLRQQMFLSPAASMYGGRVRRVIDGRVFPDNEGGSFATTMPRSHPMSSHSHSNGSFSPWHDGRRGFMMSRPQSLTPELRRQISRSMRDMSPDGGRRAKRHKVGHERLQGVQGQPVPSVMGLPRAPDLSNGEVCNIEQTLGAVEFMLRSHTEQLRNSRAEALDIARAAARDLNAVITSIDTPLAAMPSKDQPPIPVPNTGAAIRDLNTQEIHVLLDFYGVPFVSTMFLHDKKLQYLRFLGASSTLKHLVLD